MAERRGLLSLVGLFIRLGAFRVELLSLRFTEEFTLPTGTRTAVMEVQAQIQTPKPKESTEVRVIRLPLAGDRDRLELKLDTDDEDEDVFFLSVTLRPGIAGAFPTERLFLTALCRTITTR